MRQRWWRVSWIWQRFLSGNPVTQKRSDGRCIGRHKQEQLCGWQHSQERLGRGHSQDRLCRSPDLWFDSQYLELTLAVPAPLAGPPAP